MNALPTPVIGRQCGDCGSELQQPWARFCAICRPRHRGKPAKYAATAQIDDMIRLAYQKFWEFNSRRAIKATAARIGWPNWAVKKRARALGLSRTSDNKPWCPEEERLLQGIAHHCDAVIVRKLRAAGFDRTETAVHLKLKRNRIRQTLEGYSAHQLAEAFGVDSHKITRWISSGMLRADRREQARTPQQGGNAYWIRHSDVRDFAMRCPDEIDLKKVEKHWFLDLITDGRIAR